MFTTNIVFHPFCKPSLFSQFQLQKRREKIEEEIRREKVRDTKRERERERERLERETSHFIFQDKNRQNSTKFFLF